MTYVPISILTLDKATKVLMDSGLVMAKQGHIEKPSSILLFRMSPDQELQYRTGSGVWTNEDAGNHWFNADHYEEVMEATPEAVGTMIVNLTGVMHTITKEYLMDEVQKIADVAKENSTPAPKETEALAVLTEMLHLYDHEDSIGRGFFSDLAENMTVAEEMEWERRIRNVCKGQLPDPKSNKKKSSKKKIS